MKRATARKERSEPRSRHCGLKARDEGKIGIYFAIISLSWTALFGMVLAGGGKMRAYQRADNLAAEAARAAGQAIDPGSAILGESKVISPAAARTAALDYLTAAGATGDATVLAGGKQLRVTVVIEYRNPIGVGRATWEATGNATVTLIVG